MNGTASHLVRLALEFPASEPTRQPGAIRLDLEPTDGAIRAGIVKDALSH